MNDSEEPLTSPGMRRQTFPFVLPDMHRQMAPGQMKALPTADSDPYPDDFFLRRGVDLPSHLSTKRGRWTSFLIVVIVSAFAAGPIQSWATLEPILIREGVFAGPEQEAKLTGVYSLSTGIAMIAQLFAGVVYDVVGPRATAAGSAFGIVVCLAGMALAIQNQSLNFLLWVCYPAATALGYCNSVGGYAWLYLLPDSQNTVSSLIGVTQILSDSLVLIAVFFHDTLGLSLPYYFVLISVLSLVAGIVCLMQIPEHAISQEVAFIVINPNVDVEGGSYGAADRSVEREVESAWTIVKRSFATFRDCFRCFLFYCPGAFFWIVWILSFGYMFYMYSQFVMFPFYQALFGTANATALVNIKGGLFACTGAAFLVWFGRFVDCVGLQASIAFLNVPIILNFVCFSAPNFVVQVIGQVLLSSVANASWVLVPCWCLSYLPPELYGSGFGILMAILGVFQLIATPFGTFVSTVIDKSVTRHPSAAMPFLTTMGLWCFLTVISSLAYLLFMQYYKMPAPGGTTMAEVMKYPKGTTEDRESEHFARKVPSKQELPADDKHSVQKS